jgi:hypothetical protein
MRPAAATLATFVAIAQLTLFTLAQRQVQATAGTVGPPPEADWLRWIWAVAWAAPWLVAAVMFVVGATRYAAAVALTATALVAATGLGSLAVLTAPAPGAAASPTTWVTSHGGIVVWVLALLAGILAWLARPRGGWRLQAPGPVGWYVTIAVVAWLPAAFRTTQFAPPGAPRAFVETAASQLDGLDAVASVAGALTVGLLLFVAPRLRPDIGGTVLLTYAIPTLLADLGGVLRVATEQDVIFTPSGLVGLVGVAGLVIAGVVWAPREVEDASADAER